MGYKTLRSIVGRAPGLLRGPHAVRYEGAGRPPGGDTNIAPFKANYLTVFFVRERLPGFIGGGMDAIPYSPILIASLIVLFGAGVLGAIQRN